VAEAAQLYYKYAFMPFSRCCFRSIPQRICLDQYFDVVLSPIMYRKVSRFFSLDDGDSGKTKKRFHASEESASASKRPRYITELVREAAQEKKFACPYFQHSPQQYFHNRVCAGPGWRGIGDLKYG
jgi:hypothetical protein